MQNTELEELIKENLKLMIDASPLEDVEEKWQDFEKRLVEITAKADKEAVKKSSWVKKYRRIFTSVAAFVAVFLIFFSLSPQAVVGFKNEVYKWLGQTNTGDLVISESHNPEYKQGKYEELSLEEAKGMVLFEIKFPQYVPADFQSPPQISVVSDDYPKSVVDIKYKEGDFVLLLKQEKIFLEENRNTYVPQNANLQSIKIKDNLEVTMIQQDSTVHIFWTENLIKYNVIAQNITFEELVKVIETLK